MTVYKLDNKRELVNKDESSGKKKKNENVGSEIQIEHKWVYRKKWLTLEMLTLNYSRKICSQRNLVKAKLST